jgi:acetyl esterase
MFVKTLETAAHVINQGRARFATRMLAARKRAGGLLIRSTLESMSQVAKAHPRSIRLLRQVEVERNVRYAPGSLDAHLLDVYRPKAATKGLPAILYLHGGAFQILSKNTHWLMAAPFAREGFAVFNASYRLAPKHPFPAALEDCAAAFVWVVENAHRYGADPNRLIVVGESAGANLALSLAIAACFERPEPFAKRVFATGVVPRAVLPICGALQVSDGARFVRRKPHMRKIVADRIEEMEKNYLGAAAGPFADPLCLLENDVLPARALPPMYTACGTKDPLLDDTRRLGVALGKRGVRCDVDIFPGEIHAFHAMRWRPAAVECWAHQLAFVAEAVKRQS